MAAGVLEEWNVKQAGWADFHADLIKACLWKKGQATEPLETFFDTHHEKLSHYMGIRIVAPHSALLLDHCQQNSLSLPVGLTARLGALAMREEVRCGIMFEQFSTIEQEWKRLGIDALVLRGPDAAHRYYDRPEVRHCHATRWLISDEQERALVQTALLDLGWRLLPRRISHTHKQEFIKSGSGSLEIHNAAFSWPTRLSSQELGSSSFRIVELLGSAKVEQRVTGGRWLLDLAGALEQERIDPEHFAMTAKKCRLEGTCRQGLAALKSLLGQEQSSRAKMVTVLLDVLGSNRDGKEAKWVDQIVQKSGLPMRMLLAGAVCSPVQTVHAWHLRKHQRAKAQYNRNIRKRRPAAVRRE